MIRAEAPEDLDDPEYVVYKGRGSEASQAEE